MKYQSIWNAQVRWFGLMHSLTIQVKFTGEKIKSRCDLQQNSCISYHVYWKLTVTTANRWESLLSHDQESNTFSILPWIKQVGACANLVLQKRSTENKCFLCRNSRKERKLISISFNFLIEEHQAFPEVSPVSLAIMNSRLHYLVKNRKKLFIKFTTICYCSAGT